MVLRNGDFMIFKFKSFPDQARYRRHSQIARSVLPSDQNARGRILAFLENSMHHHIRKPIKRD